MAILPSVTVTSLPFVLVFAVLFLVGVSASSTDKRSHRETSSDDADDDVITGSGRHGDLSETHAHPLRPSYGRHRRAKDDGVCELEIFCGRGDDRSSTGVVRLPIRGQRGPPGPSGPPGEKGPKGQDGNGVASALMTASTAARRKVAFFAGLSDNMGPVQENTDIKFDRIVTNYGSAYDETTGKFVAPSDGVYQFNVVISAQGRQKAAVMILKNGEMVTTVWAESVPSWATSSNVVILQLVRGDRVWLSLLSRASYLHGYMYTTFSGFQIFDI